MQQPGYGAGRGIVHLRSLCQDSAHRKAAKKLRARLISAPKMRLSDCEARIASPGAEIELQAQSCHRCVEVPAIDGNFHRSSPTALAHVGMRAKVFGRSSRLLKEELGAHPC